MSAGNHGQSPGMLTTKRLHVIAIVPNAGLPVKVNLRRRSYLAGKAAGQARTNRPQK